MNDHFTKQPLVSIIINCYNGEAFLNECIKSVLSQSYKNWEVIFWDNQSEDGSAKLFKSYRDERFKYFYAKEHTPLYKARNLAIKESKGELLAFIDTDDLWTKDKLELQVPKFNDSKVTLVYSNLWIMKNNLEVKKIFIKKKSPSGFIYQKLLDDYNVGIITVIFRKNIIKDLNKIFDERFSIIGDFDFFLRLSKKYYFYYIGVPLAYYRIHNKNFSSLHKEKEMDEFNIWLNENKNNINYDKLKKIKNKIVIRKLLHFKFNKDYKNCYKILVENYKSIIVIKMTIIICIPLYILRKISWFHN
jgi:glycosyltransferase involved in cell wall biosynthesis|tara:strand:- start:841 stop:1749 length:909 start_codon:yes stop_codon:yes gene_type:complete